jgi:DNA-directed RNA polymerase specialized sigma24 family protein
MNRESRSSVKDKYVLTRQSLRDKPGLTQLAFTRLLTWLDDGDDSNGERYLEMRRRLVSYFERRDRSDAGELADETFNRIARTLGECGVIETRPPARYCYVVAKFVFLEDIQHERRYVPLDDTRTNTRAIVAGEPDDAGTVQEQRLDGLDRCLSELSATDRQFIVEYYEDVRGRKIARRRDMAARMGISMNALAIRAWRIRERLMACVEGCRIR